MSIRPTSRSAVGSGWILHRYSITRNPVADTSGGLSADASSPVASGVWSMRHVRNQPPRANSDITAVLESVIEPLRRLDDAEGGSIAAVDQVKVHIDTVDGYLRRGDATTPTVRRRLLRTSAQLYQLAGWMAYDAERHTTAQRFFAAGLRAAREIDDADLFAYILSCTARHLVYRGRFSEAVEAAEAATHAARDSHPAVRSVTASRLGNCQAASGNVSGFRAAADTALEIWADQDSSELDKPDFLYWYGEDYIDIQRSESLQLLATTLERGATTVVREADALLDQRIRRHTQTMPRDVALHTAALAWVHVRHGDLDRAIGLAEIALDQLGSVRSPRVRRALRSLVKDLGRLGAERLELPVLNRLYERLCEQSEKF